MSFIEMTMTEHSAKEVDGRVPGRLLVRASMVIAANDILNPANGQRIDTIVTLSNGSRVGVTETAAEVVSRIEIVEDEAKVLQKTQVKNLGDLMKELGGQHRD